MAAPGTIDVYSRGCYAADAGDVVGASIGIVDLGGDDVYFLYADAQGSPGDWTLVSPTPAAVEMFRKGRLEFQVVYGDPNPITIRGTVSQNAVLLSE